MDCEKRRERLVAETRVLDGEWVLGALCRPYDVRGSGVPLDPDAPRTDRRGASHRRDWQRPT